MMADLERVIEEIKQRVRIEALVGESLTVTGKGRTLTTVEHDSLKLRTDWQTWTWYSRGLRGDVFDWVQLQLGCDFRGALETLARRAGVELPALGREAAGPGMGAVAGARLRTAILETAARYYHGLLLGPLGEPGRVYLAGRGWDERTWARELIGYVPDGREAPAEVSAGDSSTDNKWLSVGEAGGEMGEGAGSLYRQLRGVMAQAGELGEQAEAAEKTLRAVLMVPGGHVVYCHRERGRVVYLSARSVVGKRHWNMPGELVGPKRLYVNEVDPAAKVWPGVRVLVEGQADAIALGQAGVAAVALGGVDGAGGELGGLGISHVGLDGDAAGQAKALQVALGLGPLTRVVRWPEGVKDAAAWVARGPGPQEIGQVLDGPSALVMAAEAAGQARGEERKRQLGRVLDLFDGLDEVEAADLLPTVAGALGESVGQFKRLRSAREKQREKEGGDGGKASPERYEHCAGMARAGLLFEQCVWEEGSELKAGFAVRLPNGQVEMRGMVDVGLVTYVPYPVDMGLIAKDVVLFPSQPAEYGSQRELVRRVQDFIHKYLDVDPFYERLAAYYVLLSWVYDLFETLPYIRALGDYGTGKTRFLQTIGAVCYRPMFVSGASTTSPIFRMIDMFQGTLIVDEADFGNSDAEAEIIKILNVGYYRGGVVLRSEKDPTSKFDEYWPAAKSVFGPKILATRRPFTDRATESRCLTKRTTTARPRPGIPYVLGREFWREAREIRNQLLLYRLRSHRPVELGMDLADSSVEPRLNQVTMALKAMVDDEAMRAEIDLFIRAYNEQLISDRQMTLPAVVVQALADTFYSTKRNLMGEDERDWSMKGIADRAQTLINEIDPGTTITAKRVGQILSEDLGLTARQRNARHRRVELVVTEEELRALQLRYGVSAAGPEGAG